MKSAFQGPDATALLEQLRSGKTSPEALVRAHLHRLEASHGQLNAACEILREEALAQVRALKPGPLAGLPISIKENYALGGHAVTLGSRRMRAIECAEDAPIVQRLKAAGAVIIARSNVPEFLMNAETDNLRYGRSRHPQDPTRTPGGSSGGEAALVASGATALGFGSDILGSIRIPASFCGLVGFRPHSAAVDKTGVYPQSGDFFESFNGLGPLARSVRDARLAYEVIAQVPMSSSPGLSGARLILARNFPLKQRESCIGQAYMAALASLKAAGLKPEEGDFRRVRGLFLNLPRLVAGEMGPLWQRWLSEQQGDFNLGAECWRSLRGAPSIYPGFLPWLLADRLLRPDAGTLARLTAKYQRVRDDMHALLGEDGVLCLPTLGMLAPRHGQMNRMTLLRPGLNRLVTAHTFVNYCDLSAITIPARRFPDPRSHLLPGIMLACAPGAEALLFEAAEGLEHAMQAPPA